VTALLGISLLLVLVLATLAGGAIPLRLERHTRTFLSFSAGALVGLALIELIPEGLEIPTGQSQPKLLIVLGAFLVTMLLDKSHVLHPHSHAMDADCPEVEHEHKPLAMPGAVGLLLHSAVDGLAMATALASSPTTAVAVAVALAAHKAADGITTVSLVLTHHHRRPQAIRLLAGNAACLVAGFALGRVLSLGEAQLGVMLLAMAGFFLYLGASDLIPSVTTPTCRKRDVVATAVGMAAIAAISLITH
jgi:ZIP family zinc transporter